MNILLCLFLFIAFPAFAADPKVFVVVNKDNRINKLSKGELQKYFLKNQRVWMDGTPVKFFDRAEVNLRLCFLNEYIGKNPEELNNFWKEKKREGELSHTQVEGDEMVVMLVSYFPGGIGYVSGKFVGDSRVKILRIGE